MYFFRCLSILVSINKLEQLKKHMCSNKDRRSSVRAAINISNRRLSTSEESVVFKGLNLGITMSPIPYLDMIAPIKEIVLKIRTA